MSAYTPIINARRLQGRTVATTAPTHGQVLVWNGNTSQWEPGQSQATNRETLAGTKTLTASSPCYQFLNPGGAHRDVVLPDPAAADMRFVFKNLDPAYNLNIKESSGGGAVETLGATYRIAECIHDGTAWHIETR